MNQTPLAMIEVNPPTTPTHSIIWLHGLGADGNDFAPIAKQLHFPDEVQMRFVFPHAPMRPVTINQGYVMRAWFDIVSLDFNLRADEEGVKETLGAIRQLIAQEEALGIPAKNIVLAGFSQGAYMALRVLLSYPEPLAGIIALSGFLSDAERLVGSAQSANQHTPVFLAHGTDDAVIPYQLGELTYMLLKQAGYQASWHGYKNMPHTVCDLEVQDLENWLGGILNRAK